MNIWNLVILLVVMAICIGVSTYGAVLTGKALREMKKSGEYAKLAAEFKANPPFSKKPEVTIPNGATQSVRH